ncbi:MAG: glycosyltransferase family 2 protein [Gammaproteobacteria bacterium]|nr:glycosyltransferase family 2 protein [Gammaproteobacteria bacterium]
MDFSIVIPAKNESGNVAPLVGEIRAALDGRYDYELIYVDDGSTDDTVARLQALKDAGFPRLRILRHQASCGQSTAVRTGVKAAQAPWIVTLDADGQNDPADIPALFECVRAPDRDPRLAVVAGWRRSRQDTWLKRVSSKVANAVRGRLLNDGTPDTGCGLKCFSRSGFLDLPYFDHMHRYLPALFRRAGGSVRIVEVNHRPRNAGKSNYGLHNRLWVGIVDLFGVMWLQRRAKRPQVLTEL